MKSWRAPPISVGSAEAARADAATSNATDREDGMLINRPKEPKQRANATLKRAGNTGLEKRGGVGYGTALMAELDDDERFYRDTEAVAFPKLDDGHLAQLEPLGSRRKVRRGKVIFKAGQRDVPLHVILSGEVEVFEAREE